jgi:hypothetical protein
MQATPMRVPVESHVRTDEVGKAVDAGAAPAAVQATARVSATGDTEGKTAGEQGHPGDSHELRERDMQVRMEHALREPDGTLDLLPSYQYALGSDGLPYAVDPYVVAAEEHEDAAPVEDVEDSEAPERAIATRERAPVDAEEPAPESTRELELERERPRIDEHVARSYARFEDGEDTPPKLDTIA